MASGSDLISSLGAGSGVDVKSLAESLVEVERAPRKAAIEDKIDTQERRIAGYSALMLSLDTLKEGFSQLNDVSDFNASTTTSSGAEVAVTTTGAATPGRLDIEISALARGQVTTSTGYASSDTAINAGAAFSIELTRGDGSVESIIVSAADSTPAGVVRAINDAGIGISASLLDTNIGATPIQILLQGDTGSDNSFTLSTDDGSGTGEAHLFTFADASQAGTISIAGVEFAVASGDTAAEIAAAAYEALLASGFASLVSGRALTDNGDGTITIGYSPLEGDVDTPAVVDIDGAAVVSASSETVAYTGGSAVGDLDFSNNLMTAADASFSVNGVSVSRATNEVSDLYDGLTLQLSQTTTPGTPVTVVISRNTEQIKSNILDLIETYNAAISDINILMGERSDDEEDIYSGSLAGDSFVRRLKDQLRTMLSGTSSTPGDGLSTLREIGLSFDLTGVASVNQDTLETALSENLADVRTVFSADTEDQSTYGAAARGVAGDAVKTLTDLISSRGTIMTQSENAEQLISNYQGRLERLESRLEQLYTRYIKQFGVMEAIVGQSNSMRDSLKSTFEGMMNIYKK